MKKLPIIFKLNEEIFYLFSFLNLIGYDEEDNPEGMHSLRKFVRQRSKNIVQTNRYSLLKRYLSKKHQGQFVVWLLCKKYSPRELTNKFSKQDLLFFQKFNNLFQKFISREKKNLFWSEAKKVYLAEKKNNYQRIIEELNNLMKVLNVDFNVSDLKKIVILPNFLDGYNRGYGPKIGKTAFIVYGPLKGEDFRLIRHEFLHSVVDPLILSNEAFLADLRRLFKHNQPKGWFKKVGYSNWAVIMDEHIIRAIEIKFQNLKLEEERKLLEQEKKKGFEYIEKIYPKLKKNYKRNEFFSILKNVLDNIHEIVL